MKKNIAVITGGEAAEVGISLKSAEVVCQHLDASKYHVYKVVIRGNDWIVESPVHGRIDKNDFSLHHEGKKIYFDAVFVALHGTPAEDGKLMGYFDMLHIPYHCAGVFAMALTFDKHRTKEYLSPLGVKTAKAFIGYKSEPMDYLITAVNRELSYPVFVKPNKNGSSYGVSKVNANEDLVAAIELAYQYDAEILVEEYIAGTEVTCGVIIHQGKVTALPITEIRSKSAFFDYQAKYEGLSQEVTPAEISPELTRKIQDTSLFIYTKLGFKGLCRIDYIIRGEEYYMLEVNSIPGMSAESIIPQQARAFGLTLTELFSECIEECIKG